MISLFRVRGWIKINDKVLFLEEADTGINYSKRILEYNVNDEAWNKLAVELPKPIGIYNKQYKDTKWTNCVIISSNFYEELQ